MRALLVILIVAILGGGPALAQPRVTQPAFPTQPVAPKLDRTRAGEAAPGVVFVDRAGAKHRIADFAGKPVLVNLWATWCAPCIAEMPALDRLAAKAGAPRVIAVSQDLAGWRAVDRFFAPGKFKAVTPYLDRDNALPLAFKAAGLPITVLYNAHGREVWRVNGPRDWDKAAVVGH
jgi:thiol-disulfide isomerase/thioredoxin